MLGKALTLEANNGRLMPVDARYLLPLRIVDGEIYTIIAYGVDEIATDICAIHH
jgi:hypothetical protein